MTAEGAKATLARAAKLAWPNAAKASDLPFPEFWKSVSAWLEFHAPHVGDKLMREFIESAVQEAVDAEALGLEPRAWIVPESVRAIWASVEAANAGGDAPAPQEGAAFQGRLGI